SGGVSRGALREELAPTGSAFRRLLGSAERVRAEREAPLSEHDRESAPVPFDRCARQDEYSPRAGPICERRGRGRRVYVRARSLSRVRAVAGPSGGGHRGDRGGDAGERFEIGLELRGNLSRRERERSEEHTSELQ